ncbi:hypothetical protein PF004_g8944 [Phytophthora fragariae]|uniref:Uncharacterized protein n=1 Tax=Phytophthora fragariae TaxID=53985 RepID=A0A6G0P5I3_9STRA|nr:hypothetical protein PF004_g8944 [Phytophthora fragariae]
MSQADRSEAESEPWYMRITLDGVVLTIKDVMLNGRLLQHHFASSIAGRPINTIKHAALRSICSKLSVPPYKNKKKENMAHLITAK